MGNILAVVVAVHLKLGNPVVAVMDMILVGMVAMAQPQRLLVLP